MCACVKGVEGTRVFASPALVVVAVCMAMHLTSCSDYLTSFCEPLHRTDLCHTGLKKKSGAITDGFLPV